jgi:hypothetical protein
MKTSPSSSMNLPKQVVKGMPVVFPAAMTSADMRGSGSWEMLMLTSAGELFQIDSPS